MAKKEKKILNVPNPKIGRCYRFIFGNHAEMVGLLTEENLNLSKSYGYKWYTFEVPGSKNDERKMWYYPASIFDIIKEEK
jgi:hypothetical protein